jgi:hypothetical protein
MFADPAPEIYNQPPQYAVPMSVMERLVILQKGINTESFDTYVSLICRDFRTNQLYHFYFSIHDMGASVWYKECWN